MPPIFNQDDGQHVKGVAFALVGRIAPRWDVNLSLQYLDSRSKSQNPANNGKRLALDAGSLGQPLDHGSAGARRPRRRRPPLYGSRCSSTPPTPSQVPRYTVADALVEAPIGRHLTLRLNIYNLTDRIYIRSINNNGGRYNPGTPRSFLLSTAVRF